jgi:hypothetical protein
MREEVASIDERIQQAAFDGDVDEYVRLTARKPALHLVILIYFERLQQRRVAANFLANQNTTAAQKRIAELRETAGNVRPYQRSVARDSSGN